MRTYNVLSLVVVAGIIGSVLAASVYANDAGKSGETVTLLMQKTLPDYPGKEGAIVMVEFPPGHVDTAHRHDAHVFVYVLEGVVEMQVEGGRAVTLKAGDTFYENPRDVHPLGRNLSNTKTAKLIVFFVKKQDAPFVLPPT